MGSVEDVATSLGGGDMVQIIGMMREQQRVGSEMQALRERVQNSPSAQAGNIPLSQLGSTLDVRV